MYSNPQTDLLSTLSRLLLGSCRILAAFLQRHVDFIETMILGGICALACLHLGFMGPQLARICLVVAGALGLLREIKTAFTPRSDFSPYP